MTIEELRERLVAQKLATWDLLRLVLSKDFVPSHAGYKSVEDAMVRIMKDSIKANESLIRQYEKENP